MTASQKLDTRIGMLEFTHDFANGYPSDTTIEKLYDERDFQRACQAYLWSVRPEGALEHHLAELVAWRADRSVRRSLPSEREEIPESCRRPAQ